MAYSLKLRMRSRGDRYPTETLSSLITVSGSSGATASLIKSSDSVCKLIRLSGKKPPAESQGRRRNHHRDCQYPRPGKPAGKERHAKCFQQVIHRVEIEKPAPTFGHNLLRINDRRQIHPRDQQNLVHLQNIRKIGSQRGKKERDAERKHRGQEDRNRQKDQR